MRQCWLEWILESFMEVAALELDSSGPGEGPSQRKEQNSRGREVGRHAREVNRYFLLTKKQKVLHGQRVWLSG